MTLFPVSSIQGAKRVQNKVQKGPDPGRTGPKGSQTPPYQALGALEPLIQGYLDLSNTYPRWPVRAPGYRAGLTEDTGTRRTDVLRPSLLPGAKEPH